MTDSVHIRTLTADGMMCAHRALPTMMLFVYDWFYNGSTVYGHCLDESGKYAILKVHDFYPSCYIEGDSVPDSSAVHPVRVEYKDMASSCDISTPRPFCRMFWKSAKDMEIFSREHRCYMAEIPQIPAFLSQIGADRVGWVQVHNANMSVSMSDRPIGVPEKVPLSDPIVMAFDIEVKSSDSGMPQPYKMYDTVEMISVVVFGGGAPTNKYIMHTLEEPLCITETTDIICDDEVQLIKKFFEMIHNENPTVITGFNIYGFDMHYLVSRLKLRLEEIPDVSRGAAYMKIIKVDWASDAYGHNNYERLVIGGRVIIDMYLYFKRMKLDKYSLDFVSNKFLGEGKDDMSYAKMVEAWTSGNREALRTVAAYCVKDSVLVMKLFEKVQMWIDVCEISKITGCGIEDIYTRGEQMKLMSQCVAECTKRDIVLQPLSPLAWRQYEGGYVLDPKKGVYNGCSILDFQSLYPSIIIAYNICPSTYTNSRVTGTHQIEGHRFLKKPVGLLPGMIKQILDERKAVKEDMAKIGDSDPIRYIVLDRRQNALKVCANSVYGMMGFKNSRYFGHVGCAESVTTVGRLLLADVVSTIEKKYPVRVVYGDTDSCILWHTDERARDDNISLARSICDDITALLPAPMALKFEKYCDKAILFTKKRYVVVSGDSISYKGVMNARRDYCKFARNTYGATMEKIAKGASNEDIKKYVDDMILRLHCGKIPMHDLVITKCLAKNLASYKVNQPHVVLAKRLAQQTGVDIPAGTRIEYVYVDHPIRTVTPQEFAEGQYQVDCKYYISKQLATQVDELLALIGMENYVSLSWIS
jgi:DNA polymerase delta subunit 1